MEFIIWILKGHDNLQMEILIEELVPGETGGIDIMLLILSQHLG